MSADTESLPLLSKVLNLTVSAEIGQECIVQVRREKCDIANVLNECNPSNIVTRIVSGSKAEGFEMKTSDFDIMAVLNDVAVIPSYHPLLEGCSPQQCVMIYETDYTSPGFAVIRCSFLGELNKSHGHISDSLVWNSLGPYVSSKLFRDYLLRIYPSAEVHGPCICGEKPYGDIDIAYCLRCPYWPREASAFMTRSMRSGWPSQQVVTDICNDGCLFVPISSKALHCQDAVEMEWRMSFSLAEKKLVYTMNHCQFLCYGLLKLFLNDVMKKIEDINDLLCSYFMKTALFWEISEDKSGWTSHNFLCKFWKTFCRLLGWVHVGYCPNFFNPDNNMFAGKIHGHKQRLLMEVLVFFHSEGVGCLLRCPYLNTKLMGLLQLTMHFGQFDVVTVLSEVLSVPQWRLENLKIRTPFDLPGPSGFELFHAFKEIQNIRNIRPTSSVMTAALKYAENKGLQNIGEIFLAELTNSNLVSISNKAWMKYFHTALDILYKNGTTFCKGEIIVAKWLYTLGWFHNVVHILNSVTKHLSSSQFMYQWAMNEAGYRRLRRSDNSYISFLKSNIVDSVVISEETTIGELLLELRRDVSDPSTSALFIPPVVFVYFLLLLSYNRLGDTVRRNDVLRDLHVLLWYDEDYHIPIERRAISWEILGISQQLCGDYHGAYQSYINALNDKYNEFKTATHIRIVSLANA